MLIVQSITVWDDSKGDHPIYTKLDWVAEVMADATRCGYAEWVAHQIEAETV